MGEFAQILALPREHLPTIWLNVTTIQIFRGVYARGVQSVLSICQPPAKRRLAKQMKAPGNSGNDRCSIVADHTIKSVNFRDDFHSLEGKK